MSEAADQAADLGQLTAALLDAQEALHKAEQSAKDYATALENGATQADRAKTIELIAAKEVARAQEQAAAAAVRAAAARRVADNDAAASAVKAAAAAKALASERERAEKEAAVAATEAWKAANERGRVATDVAREHARATQELERNYAGAARAAASGAVGFVRTNASISGFAAAAGPYVAGIAGIAHVLGEATAEAGRHERALRILGSAYQEIERATNGAMSAEQALNLQGQIQSAGVQVNAQQLALLARAAREYALATGNDAQQAVEKLSNAIVNNSEDALSELNLAQARATNSAQTLANMTDLLAQRYRGVAPAAQQADERVEAFNRAAKEAGTTLLAGVAQGAESALSALIRLGGGTESATQTLRNFSKEFRDWLSGEAEASNAASNRALANIQRATQQYELQRRAFQNSSMLEGSGIQLPSANELTVRQRQAMVELFDESSRLSNADFQQRMRNILALAEQERAAATARREQSEADRQAQAINAADRRTHAGDDIGMLRRQAESLGLRINMQQQSVSAQQRLNFLQRELGRLLTDEEKNRAGIQKTMSEMIQIRQQQQAASNASQRLREQEELRRAAEDLNTEIDLAYRYETRVLEVERRRGETAIEYLRRRVELQRESNQLALDGRAIEDELRDRNAQSLRDKEEERVRAEGERRIERADAEDEARREQARLQLEQNKEAIRRDMADRADARLRESFGLAQEQSTTATQAMAAGAKTAYDAFGELASGIAGAAKAAADKGEDAGAAVAKYVDDWAGAKAVQWGLQAAEALAGAGVAYFIRPDAVPGLLASAAQYAGLAAVAGVTAAAIPNAPTTGAGGAAGGDRLAASSRSESSANAKGPSYVINVSGFVTREDVEDGLVRAMRSAQSRHGDFLR